MDGVVAGRADDEGLAPHLCHELRPCGLWSPRLGEVGELADLVCLHLDPLFADLAPACAKPLDQLVAFGAGASRGWLAIGEDRFLLPFQGYSAEPCDQWFPALS